MYMFFGPSFFFQPEEKFVKCSDSQIFHFYESSKSSQRILLAFGLLFFHRTSFTKYWEFQAFVVHQELAKSVQWLGHDSMVLLFWLLQRQFWAYSCSLLLYFLVWKFIRQDPTHSQWKGNYRGVSLRSFNFLSVEFGENLS